MNNDSTASRISLLKKEFTTAHHLGVVWNNSTASRLMRKENIMSARLEDALIQFRRFTSNLNPRKELKL